MKYILILPLLLAVSCANGPTVVVRSDGTTIANLGQSLFEDTEGETASITLADGTQLTQSKTGKAQTKVPAAWIGYKTLIGLADLANQGEAIREKGATARTGQSASVEKARIDADVTKATFVPPE